MVEVQRGLWTRRVRDHQWPFQLYHAWREDSWDPSIHQGRYFSSTAKTHDTRRLAIRRIITTNLRYPLLQCQGWTCSYRWLGIPWWAPCDTQRNVSNSQERCSCWTPRYWSLPAPCKGTCLLGRHEQGINSMESHLWDMQRDWTNTLKRDTYVSWYPEGTWQKIGADLFTYHVKEYPITVCYKSNFLEVDSLTNTKSLTVMKKWKSHMAQDGIPKQLVTDNSPQFTSRKLKSYTRRWGIEHTIIWSHHSKTRRKVESVVKIAQKNITQDIKIRRRRVLGSTQYLQHTNPRCCQ